MIPQRDLRAEIDARHKDKLPTPEIRREYAKKVIAAMEASARALLQTAEALRADPDGMLACAFEPNIFGMHPNTTATLELAYSQELGQVEVRGRAIVDGTRLGEIGFRALLKDGAVTPVRDNRFG